mgnify:CR=1 FL=1
MAGVIASSDFTARRVRELDLHPGKARVVQPGCAPAPLARGTPTGAPLRFLCVASLTPRKGHDVLLAALEKLRGRRWTCQLAGPTDADPAWAERCRQHIARAGLEDRIQLTGALSPEALDAAYDSADVFVLASRYEGYGMVITEAIARGLPVVSTNGGALAQTLPKGAGIQVPVGDAATLAAALGTLLDNSARRHRLAAAAREARARLIDWPETGRRFARAIEECSTHA